MTDRPRHFWLMKSEPEVYGIDDLERDGWTHWDGVRNFKARNYMKEMEIGDGVLFYHSNAKPPGIAGVARVCRTAYPDFTQFDPDSHYHDPRATKEKPWWYMVDIEFVSRFPKEIPCPSCAPSRDRWHVAPEARPAPLRPAGDPRGVGVPPRVRRRDRHFGLAVRR